MTEDMAMAEKEWGDMTDEEKQADVDALVEEAQAKERAESVPDDEPEETKLPEDSGAGDETPADADAAEETEPQGSDETPDEDESEWLDDSTRGFATSMGLTEEDLESLTSREDLDRVLRIIDRKAFEAGKAAMGKPPEAPLKQEPEKPKEDVLTDLEKFKIGDDFDPGAAEPINKFVEAAAAEIRSLRSDLAGLLQQREQEAADSIRRQALESLHTLGHKELFGEPGKQPTREQAKNIARAIDAHLIHAAGLFAMGRQAAPTPDFLKTAVRMEFGDQISKTEQRLRIEKLKKQSARRTGGVSSKTLQGRKSGQSMFEAIKEDPDIDKLFNELVSERSG
jgi:hypothetical protein